MTAPDLEWHRGQCEHNRRIYERLHAAWPDDAHDWKANALSYSALRRVNYHFATKTGRAPDTHFEGNLRVRREMPRARGAYMGLYTMSTRARYHDGSRTKDPYRGHALGPLELQERLLPFP